MNVACPSLKHEVMWKYLKIESLQGTSGIEQKKPNFVQFLFTLLPKNSHVLAHDQCLCNISKSVSCQNIVSVKQSEKSNTNAYG